MAAARWEHYEHQADIGVRGFGASPEGAFEQAAVALVAVIVDPATVADHEAISLTCTAPDRELLLADWLNAVIFAMATRRMLFHRFAVQIDGEQLSATAWGEPIDIARHRPAVEVKGATYTDLAVRRGEEDGWVAQCVVDV
jgi:tRNA nucleotidyltransferase (CCA-adding enzyme)